MNKMLSEENLRCMRVADLLATYPFLNSFFEHHDIEIREKENLSLQAVLDAIGADEAEDRAFDGVHFIRQMREYILQMLDFLDENDDDRVNTLTILPGTDKAGNPESFEKLVIRPGDVISIVGPTGSGKSRLLADIEWVARKDTPTGRTILINDKPADSRWRFSASDKLVAQLSQNMNFVMDLTVMEFLELHAESRMVENRSEVIAGIIEQANLLAGERFDPATPVTALSGGQSRALMIADTAILSRSPIVLIDEVENAGIDRKKALALLLAEDKIVFMATHDPMLALMGQRRIVIRNGGIHRIMETTEEERGILVELEEIDNRLRGFRNKLRAGMRLTEI